MPVIQRVRKTCTAEVPLVGRLTGIEEVKVEAIAMSKLHNMSCPPYMGHSAAVIFHLIYLSLM